MCVCASVCLCVYPKISFGQLNLNLSWHIYNVHGRLSHYCLCSSTGMASCLFTSRQLPVTQMRTSAWTVRSVGEHRATTPLEASAASAPPASTTSRQAEAARTSTSAPPARTPASLDAPTQTGDTSVDVHLDTSAQDKGTCVNEWLCVKDVCRCFQLTDGFVFVSGIASQVWALVMVAQVLDKEDRVRRMRILCLLRHAMNVRSTATPRRDANVAAPTQHKKILWKTCR